MSSSKVKAKASKRQHAADAFCVPGTQDSYLQCGLVCNNPKVKEILEATPMRGHRAWQHDTLWFRTSEQRDFAIQHLQGFGFIVE